MRIFLYTVVDGDYFNPPFVAGGDNEAKHAVKVSLRAQKLCKNDVGDSTLQIIGEYDNSRGSVNDFENQVVCMIRDLCEEVTDE